MGNNQSNVVNLGNKFSISNDNLLNLITPYFDKFNNFNVAELATGTKLYFTTTHYTETLLQIPIFLSTKEIIENYAYKYAARNKKSVYVVELSLKTKVKLLDLINSQNILYLYQYILERESGENIDIFKCATGCGITWQNAKRKLNINNSNNYFLYKGENTRYAFDKDTPQQIIFGHEEYDATRYTGDDISFSQLIMNAVPYVGFYEKATPSLACGGGVMHEGVYLRNLASVAGNITPKYIDFKSVNNDFSQKSAMFSIGGGNASPTVLNAITENNTYLPDYNIPFLWKLNNTI